MKPAQGILGALLTLTFCAHTAYPQSSTAAPPAASPQSVVDSMAALLSGESSASNPAARQSSVMAAVQSAAPAVSPAPDTPVLPAADTGADANDNPGGSDVRIVRLSQTNGQVSMDRNIGKGFETAFPNLPVIQGAKLQTANGIGEVEFEDDSTLRLTPGTLIEFSTLQRDAAGGTVSRITVLRGTVYVDLEKTRGNSFTLASRDGLATLPPAAQVRLSASTMGTAFAVFKGDVAFTGSSKGSALIGKGKELFVSQQVEPTEQAVVKAQEDAYDNWNKNESDFHKQYSKGSALTGSPYSYGLIDLNYYGSFADLPGCGRVWRPYFVSAAWDPYSNGLWAWYPDAGFTWVSVYPWGWVPFHYGAWEECGAGVWGWAPGGRWNGLGFGSAWRGHRGPWRPFPGGPIHHPFPPRPPHLVGGKTLLAVNTRPLTVSGLNPLTRSFVIRNDSAGLGIPRETFGKLSKTAGSVEHQGSASIAMLPVYGHPGEGQHGGSVSWHPANGAGAPTSGATGSHAWSGSSGGSSHPSGGYSGGSVSHAGGGGSFSGGGGGASHAGGSAAGNSSAASHH